MEEISRGRFVLKQFRISILFFLATLLASYSANNFSHLFDNISLAYIVFTALCIFFALLGLLTAVIASIDDVGVLRPPKSMGVLACWILAIPQIGLAIGLVINYNSYVDIIATVKSYSGDEIQNLGDGVAMLDGDIGYGTFLSMLDAHQEEEITLLKLRSNGGVLSPAISIGEFLRENRIATLVDSYCESACVLVALYGSTLHVTPEAKFGFHRGRSVASNESELGQDIARQGTNSLISKFEELGVPEHILEMAEKTPPHETYYVSGSELFRAGVARLVEK